MRLSNALHVLQAAESTPTSTSGSAPAGDTPQPPGTPIGNQGTVVERPVDEEVDWEAESRPDGDVSVDETPTPDKDETPPQPEKPKAPPKAEEPKAPAPKPEGEQPPKPEEQPPQPKTPEQPPEPQPETAEAKAARDKQAAEVEAKALSDLTEYYKLPEADAERLLTEPALVLPELAAKVHRAVFLGLQQYMTQAVPQLLQQHQKYTEANEATKKAFYDRWPSLKDHEKEVLDVGRMFAQMNPKSTKEERLEKVGQLACAALGITPDPAKGAAPQPTPKPGQPRAAPRTPAMRPANPSGSSAGAPPPSDNVFEQIAQEFLDEDAGV